MSGWADVRDRDGEFAATEGPAAAEISKLLRSAVEDACAVVEAIPAEGLDQTVEFRGRAWTVLEAVEHFGW